MEATIPQAPDATESGAVHRAIDRVSAVLIQLQILRRTLDRGQIIAHDHYDELLAQAEQAMHALGEELVKERDRARATVGQASRGNLDGPLTAASDGGCVRAHCQIAT